MARHAPSAHAPGAAVRAASTPSSPRRPAMIVLLWLLAAGCAPFSSAGERTPGPVRVRVSASARLNLDDRGESLPTTVRLYQLKGSAKARAVALEALLRDPREALGDEFVCVDELFVDPGGSSERTFAIEKGVRTVAVVAVFRRPVGEGWRELVELPSSGRATALEYVLDGYRMARGR